MVGAGCLFGWIQRVIVCCEGEELRMAVSKRGRCWYEYSKVVPGFPGSKAPLAPTSVGSPAHHSHVTPCDPDGERQLDAWISSA